MGGGESREILARALELVVMVIEMEPGFRDFGFFFFFLFIFYSFQYVSSSTVETRRIHEEKRFQGSSRTRRNDWTICNFGKSDNR